MPLFLSIYCTSLLKTPWEKEKLLLRSNLALSHSVFSALFENFFAVFIKFGIVFCKFFLFGRVYNLPFGKKLNSCWLNDTEWGFIDRNYEPFPKQHILDSSKLKEFEDDNFTFDESGRKFSKWVENTVGKGEIARYEQFIPFPQCFQKTCTADT